MLSSIILLVVVLSILVLVHELGHFVTALWVGAKVEEFGIGFPPRAYSWVKKGIKYSLNWIPLGGFVRIKGETGQDRDDPDSFAGKPVWKRFIVLSAGVVMNFVLAAVLLSIGFAFGIPHVIDENLPDNVTVRDEAISLVTVLPESPAGQAGLSAGDELASINGQVFDSSEEAQAYIQTHVDEEINIMIKRGNDFYSYSILAEPLTETNGEKALGLGIIKTGLVSYPFYMAPIKGVVATIQFTRAIVIAFVELIGNAILHQQVAVDLSGPVGIAVITGQMAQLGILHLIQFTALLSINLAVLNFIPFPALDGGRVLFLAIEKIMNRPINPKIEAVVHNIGFLVLMVLIVLVTYRDIVRFGDQIVGVFR